MPGSPSDEPALNPDSELVLDPALDLDDGYDDPYFDPDTADELELEIGPTDLAELGLESVAAAGSTGPSVPVIVD